MRHRRTGDHPRVERVLRAVAQAHRATGVPITTHTHAHTRRGLEQQRVFAEEGVDLSWVVIGHSGDTTDLDYLEELIAAGSYLGMDRFGLDNILPFEDRVDTVARMCERGHAGKIIARARRVVLHRLASGSRIAVRAAELALPAHPQRRAARAAAARVSEEQITTMLVDNRGRSSATGAPTRWRCPPCPRRAPRDEVPAIGTQMSRLAAQGS